MQFGLVGTILGCMTIPVFQVVEQPNHSFNVNLTAADGRLKTIPGFSSEHEAAAWIVQTERMLQGAEPRFRSAPRDKGHHWCSHPSSTTVETVCRPISLGRLPERGFQTVPLIVLPVTLG